jgi:hypothetical protein
MCDKIVLLTALAILLIAVYFNRSEKFATKQEKAETIYGWFTKNDTPTYTKYKADLPDANIVEYEDSLKLKQKGALSLDNVLKHI